jgi:hypothetical protein
MAESVVDAIVSSFKQPFDMPGGRGESLGVKWPFIRATAAMENRCSGPRMSHCTA